MDRPSSASLGHVRTAALVATFVACLALAQQAPTALDADLARRVYDLPSWLEPPIALAMFLGTRLGAVVVGSGLLLARRAQAALLVVLSAFVAWLVTTGIKHAVGRPRPTRLDIGGLPRVRVDGFAFPSAHTGIAVAVAVTLAQTLPPEQRTLRWLGWGVAGVIGLGRVYLGAHWPTDVLAGVSVGWAAAAFTHSMHERVARRA